VKRACAHVQRGRGPYRVPAPQPLRFREAIELSREEVFEVCGRLSLAHQALGRAGNASAAVELAWVFDLMERRVVG